MLPSPQTTVATLNQLVLFRVQETLPQLHNAITTSYFYMLWVSFFDYISSA